MKAANPARVLPKGLIDPAFGFCLFRNGWRGRDDCMVALSANARPEMGLYSFQDAGSFRLYGWGTRWAEQASRADRGWQPGISRALENVVIEPNGHPGSAGRIVSAETGAAGGRIMLDLSATTATGARATRDVMVDFSGACGAPAFVRVTDEFDDGLLREWVMHTAGSPRVCADGFEIAGAAGACLHAKVMQPAAATMTIEPGATTRAIRIKGRRCFQVAMRIRP